MRLVAIELPNVIPYCLYYVLLSNKHQNPFVARVTYIKLDQTTFL